MKTVYYILFLTLSFLVTQPVLCEDDFSMFDDDIGETSEVSSQDDRVERAPQTDESHEVGTTARVASDDDGRIAAMKETLALLKEKIDAQKEKIRNLEERCSQIPALERQVAELKAENEMLKKSAHAKAQAQKSSQAQTGPIKPGTVVEAEQLCKEFAIAERTRSNAAMKRYANVFFKVSGVVDSFEQRVGETKAFLIYLRVSNKRYSPVFYIRFADFDKVEIRESEERIVAFAGGSSQATTLLQLGQNIVVQGTFKGRQYSGLFFDNASIVGAER